jgi:hypothetical protein
MLVKFFARGKGRGAGPVDYLLGKDRARQDATLLRGDADQIVQLIDSHDFTRKYTSGVLSFSEPDITDKQKDKIIDSFEKTLFPGLDKDQYSVLWAQHQDKDRLELNFVIPNIELQSGKRLQPYYHKTDEKRVNAWKNIVNDAYNFSDPNDPARERLAIRPKDLPKTRIQAVEAITRGLVAQGVKDRQSVVQALESFGFEVSRQTKKSISIKDPEGGKALRLKGAMYEESFRADQGLRERIEEAAGAYQAGRAERIQRNKRVYQNGIRKRKEYLQSRYARDTARYAYDAERPLHQAPELGLVDTSKSVDTATHSSDVVHVSKRLQSSRGDQDTGRQLYSVQRSEGQKQRPDDVSNGVAENDRTRATIATSLRELTTRLRKTVSGLVTKYVRTATESRKPREYDHYEQQYKQQGLNAISADRSSERYGQSL